MKLSEFGDLVKQKYQQYVQQPSAEIGNRVIEKYPVYRQKVTDLSENIIQAHGQLTHVQPTDPGAIKFAKQMVFPQPGEQEPLTEYINALTAHSRGQGEFPSKEQQRAADPMLTNYAGIVGNLQNVGAKSAQPLIQQVSEVEPIGLFKPGVKLQQFKIDETSLNKIVDDINQGGVTFDINKMKSLGGQKYTAVSVYPERSKIFKSPIVKSTDILKYIRDNLDLLSRKNHTLGGWYDTKSKQLYLDVAAAVADEEVAIKLGKQFNQKAVFNLERFEEISTGGTGEKTGFFGSLKDRIKLIEEL